MADTNPHRRLADRPAAPLTDEQIEAAAIGAPSRADGPITLVAYDPAWPRLFAREAARIRAALGDRVLRLEHTGSTSVPGLAAKPIIDMLLVVADSADEPSYVPALEAAGYVLRIREPEWHQHRLFKGPDTNINLHVLSQGSDEIERILLFRDRLRADDAERDLYAQTKRELAARHWTYVQNYADAKSEVVEAIIARARAAATEDSQVRVRKTGSVVAATAGIFKRQQPARSAEELRDAAEEAIAASDPDSSCNT